MSTLVNAFGLCLIAYDHYASVVKMQQFIKIKPSWQILTLIVALWMISTGKEMRILGIDF